jgi:xanthine/CO dehydrogenase XdhC/CoxF family maturation factor
VSAQRSFAAIAREDGRAALVTAVSGPRTGERLLVRADGAPEGTLGDAALAIMAELVAVRHGRDGARLQQKSEGSIQ